MESENEVAVKEEKEMLIENSEATKENMISTYETKAKQGLKESSKSTKSSKKESNPRISVAFGRSTRASLSQSLSFPSRGRHADIMKRSIEVYPTKSEVRQSQKNSSKVESRVAEGSGSGRRINPVGKKPFPGVNGKPTLTQYSSGKLSRNGIAATATTPASDPLVDKKSDPILDDARSTTSSNLTPGRINVSSFSFRLEERAEKRKEFFSKIEQKVQAKEVEKNNMKEKSKENQEAEIKQFRKSLTFKATPMPSFYTETPPKVELKKIPTTRPISPKLGRNKGSSSENGASPRFARDVCKSPRSPMSTNEKKSTKSSLSRVLAQESTTPRKGKIEKQTYVQDMEEKDSCCSNGSVMASSSNPEAMPAQVAVEG